MFSLIFRGCHEGVCTVGAKLAEESLCWGVYFHLTLVTKICSYCQISIMILLSEQIKTELDHNLISCFKYHQISSKLCSFTLSVRERFYFWLAEKVAVVFKLDCKTVGFFLKISKEIGKAWRMCLTRAKLQPQSRSLFSTSFQTFCSTALAYLNTQKYGLFCSLFSNQQQCLGMPNQREYEPLRLLTLVLIIPLADLGPGFLLILRLN